MMITLRLQHTHTATYQPRQCHPGLGADKLDGVSVVDVAVLHGELFRLALVVGEQVDGEGTPAGGTGVEARLLHVQVARAHRLRAQPVEQSHFGARRDAH